MEALVDIGATPMKIEIDAAAMELASEAAAKPKAMWRFGLALWSIPGIKDLCLKWQDRFGFDASFFVFLCWVILREERFLDTEQLEAAAGTVAQWRALVLEPARNARKATKAACPRREHPEAAAIFKLLRSVELRAELLEQETLLNWFKNASSPIGGAVTQNALETQIKFYVMRLSADFDECDLRKMCDSIFSADMLLPRMSE
jgi:uncharacterized protein (TIGR02444 family)